MAKYWKSMKDQNAEEIGRQTLDLLLSLTGKKTSNDDSDGVLRAWADYSNLLGQDFSPKDVKPNLLGEIREHLSGRIESIMDACLQLHDEFPLWTIEGGIQLVVNPAEAIRARGRRDAFIIKGLVQDPTGSDSDPLKKAKDLVDASLVNLIYILDLKPSRFRKCGECGSYFYQPTTREKNYCSAQCSAKVRKRRFIGRKKQKGVVHQETQEQ